MSFLVTHLPLSISAFQFHKLQVSGAQCVIYTPDNGQMHLIEPKMAEDREWMLLTADPQGFFEHSYQTLENPQRDFGVFSKSKLAVPSPSQPVTLSPVQHLPLP